MLSLERGYSYSSRLSSNDSQRRRELYRAISSSSYQPQRGFDRMFHPIRSVDQLNRVPATRFESSEQSRFLRNLILATKLPTVSINHLDYHPRDRRVDGMVTLATAHMSGPEKGKFTAYKDLDQIPAVGQLGATVHELIHLSSAFDIRHDRLYGSWMKRERMANFVRQFSYQTESTRVFLNGYHSYLYNQLQRGSITQKMWFEENQAILVEMAVTDPAKLREVERSQLRRLAMKGRLGGAVHIVSQRNPNGTWNKSVLDETLMQLTKVKTVEALNAHWQNLRDTLRGKVTPLHGRRYASYHPMYRANLSQVA